MYFKTSFFNSGSLPHMGIMLLNVVASQKDCIFKQMYDLLSENVWSVYLFHIPRMVYNFLGEKGLEVEQV